MYMVPYGKASIASLQGLETGLNCTDHMNTVSSIASLQGLETLIAVQLFGSSDFFNSLPPRIGNLLKVEALLHLQEPSIASLQGLETV